MIGQKLGYKRVSTLEQDTDRQLDGMELHKIYTDKISGTIKDRPQLAACIDYAREGDTIYIHSIDRLARNLMHLQELVSILIAKGVTVVFVKESLTFGVEANPMNQLLLQVVGAIAEFERTLIAERRREGTELAKRNGTKSGKPIGKPPLDYTRRGEAIELSKQGMNISEISRSMNLSRNSVYKLLS